MIRCPGNGEPSKLIQGGLASQGRQVPASQGRQVRWSHFSFVRTKGLRGPCAKSLYSSPAMRGPCTLTWDFTRSAYNQRVCWGFVTMRPRLLAQPQEGLQSSQGHGGGSPFTGCLKSHISGVRPPPALLHNLLKLATSELSLEDTVQSGLISRSASIRLRS